MGSSGGGAGNPAAYTGGAPSKIPLDATGRPGTPPSYPNFLGGLGGGMATPESVATAMPSMPAAMAAPMAAPQGAGFPPPPGMGQQGPGDLRAMIARMMMQQDRERADALGGGYFSGTNQRRQELLRANRQSRPHESASSGSRAGGSAGGRSGGLY